MFKNMSRRVANHVNGFSSPLSFKTHPALIAVLKELSPGGHRENYSADQNILGSKVGRLVGLCSNCRPEAEVTVHIALSGRSQKNKTIRIASFMTHADTTPRAASYLDQPPGRQVCKWTVLHAHRAQHLACITIAAAV